MAILKVEIDTCRDVRRSGTQTCVVTVEEGEGRGGVVVVAVAGDGLVRIVGWRSC